MKMGSVWIGAIGVQFAIPAVAALAIWSPSQSSSTLIRDLGKLRRATAGEELWLYLKVFEDRGIFTPLDSDPRIYSSKPEL